MHAKNKGIADLVGQYVQKEEDKRMMAEAGVTPNEVNQMKLEEEIRKYESAQEAKRAYEELSQKWSAEEKEYGYDITNMAKFNDA